MFESGWFWLIALVAILWLFSKERSTSSRKSSKAATGTSRKTKNLDWLEARWARLQRERQAGTITTGPAWFFEPATERQIAYAKELGIGGKLDKMTKGQVSDLIGLEHDPDDHDVEVLKFFKESIRGMSQTEAREKVALLMADPARKAAFENRPATSIQRAVLAYAGIKAAKDVKQTEVNSLIEDKAKEFENDEETERWLDGVHEFESLLEEFDDKEFRDDYEIKKPSPAKIRKAIDQLESKGKSLASGEISSDDVAETLLEMFPELAKEDALA